MAAPKMVRLKLGYQICRPNGERIAAATHAEEAAVIVSVLAPGSTIRDERGRVLWSEGDEEQVAAESYDFVAETVHARLEGAS